MRHLIENAKLVVEAARNSRTALPHGENDLAYLDWMIETVEGAGRWPPDKSARWLGFVACTATMIGGDAEPSPEGIVEGTLIEPVPDHEKALRDVNVEVARTLLLALPVGPNTNAHALLLSVLQSRTAIEAAIRLGFAQGYLAARGQLSVDGERDRTRPLFHAAYAACGYEIPASRSKGDGR